MESLVASDAYAGADTTLLGGDADTIANANDAEMNAEYEQLSSDHEERMEEEVEQGDDAVLDSKPTGAFPPVLEEGGGGETEEVMEYDQDGAEEADEDGDIDIGEADEGADVVIADEDEQVDQEGQDDSAYEQPTEEVQEVVLNDEQEEQQDGDAPEATEVEPDHQSVPGMATESEQVKLAMLQESDTSGGPSASDPPVEATSNDTLVDAPKDAPGAESEPVAAQEPLITGSTVSGTSPSDGQQGEGDAEVALSSEKEAAETVESEGAEQAAENVEDDDQAGEGSSSESWEAEAEEDEVAIEPIRLSFQDQSFAVFSADPESTSYLAWDDETDTLKTVPAPRMAVEEDVFWSPLEALFNALRVKDALGEFLEGESGSELVMTFPELELTVREDNVYAREISLTHLIRLHHQLGLRDSMHIRISEDSRFISQYNLLAQQIAQAQKQGAEDVSGDEVGAPEAEEALAGTLSVTPDDDRVNGEDGSAPDHNVGASKTEAIAHEGVDEASATVADDVDPTATEEPADTQGGHQSAGSDLSGAKNANVDASSAPDAEAEQEGDAQQDGALATLADGEHVSDASGEAGGAEEEIIEYQEEGEGQLPAYLADQEEEEVGEQSASYEETDVPHIGDEPEEGQQGLDAEADAEEEEEEEGDYVDETQEAEAGGANDGEAGQVVEDLDADQWQGAEAGEEEEDAAADGDHVVYTEEDATEAADLGTADYEEHLHEETGEMTADFTNGDKGGAATSLLPESIPNGASKRRHADDDVIEEASSETEAKKAKVA